MADDVKIVMFCATGVPMEEQTQQVLQGCNTHRILELFV